MEVTFDAGHRVLGHRGKCAAPHGHTYRIELFFTATHLNNLGFAIDFGDLKVPVKGWIDANWDHAFLVNSADEELRNALAGISEAKIYVLSAGNPSAEILAHELYKVVLQELRLPVRSVRVWESAGQYSEFIPEATREAEPISDAAFPQRSNA